MAIPKEVEQAIKDSLDKEAAALDAALRKHFAKEIKAKAKKDAKE